MSRAQDAAYRLRGLLLAAGVLFALLGVTWLVLPCFNEILFDGRGDYAAYGLFRTPMSPGRLVEQDIPSYLANVSFVLGILLIAQWTFYDPAGTGRLA